MILSRVSMYSIFSILTFIFQICFVVVIAIVFVIAIRTNAVVDDVERRHGIFDDARLSRSVGAQTSRRLHHHHRRRVTGRLVVPVLIARHTENIVERYGARPAWIDVAVGYLSAELRSRLATDLANACDRI